MSVLRFMRFLVTVLLAVSACFCAISGSAADPLTIKDALNRNVTLSPPAKRVVLFELYEFVAAMNRWDRIAGLSRHAFSNDLVKVKLAQSKADIADVGAASTVSIERLKALGPDLVITWNTEPDRIALLERQGFNPYAISLESLEDLYRHIALLGRILAAESEAARITAQMRQTFALATEPLRDLPAAERRRGLFLMSRPSYVAGGKSMQQDLMAMIGVDNVAAGVASRYEEVSLEKMVSWNPDVIFILGSAPYEASALSDDPRWKLVEAVKRGAVYKLNRWASWSPRLPLTVLWMAKKAHPQRFADVDLAKIADSFYRDVFQMGYGDADPLTP
jgi:iron complex transport system substrate-binding protein